MKKKEQEVADLDFEKLVCNLSSRDLSTFEKQVLAKGLNFVPTPKTIDYVDLIGRVEQGLRNVEHSRANELRCSITNCLVSRTYHPTMNLSPTEFRVLKQLKREQSIITTKADKGNVVVLMDRQAYNVKVTELLNTGTYSAITKDPTETVRKTLIGKVADLYEETNEEKMINITKWLRYTTNFASPELFCLPKIHKEDVPLRPVIASGQCVTSYLCRYLTTILKPLTGHRRSHAENSLSFATEIKQIELQDSDILVSYDVTDLFTSIPLDLTYQIISELLSNDVSLNERTKLNPYHITKLVKFCMEDGNYFHWKGSFYSQKRGAPMGSSLSPIIAEIFMEHLEEVAFPTGFQNFHLKAFKRYVDDVFTIVEEGKDRDLLEHLNSLFLDKILFTMEKETGGQLPFLDLLVMREENRMTTKVYRKPTHSGRYLNFLSNHPLNVKVGIITGMVDRAVNLCSREYFNEELDHIRRTLQQNDFPKRLADIYIGRRLNNPRGNLTASEEGVVNTKSHIRNNPCILLIYSLSRQGTSVSWQVSRHLAVVFVGCPKSVALVACPLRFSLLILLLVVRHTCT
uniref:Reverse transcriptase domain-containing protein n=1 Tax=Trichuris muris TaxID=70415 RepID=A0A5S6QSY2_TRIMR